MNTRRLTCTYRHANACNTPVTKSLSELPFKPSRYITNMTQVMLSSYITLAAPENIKACPELGPTNVILLIRESGKD